MPPSGPLEQIAELVRLSPVDVPTVERTLGAHLEPAETTRYFVELHGEAPGYTTVALRQQPSGRDPSPLLMLTLAPVNCVTWQATSDRFGHLFRKANAHAPLEPPVWKAQLEKTNLYLTFDPAGECLRTVSIHVR